MRVSELMQKLQSAMEYYGDIDPEVVIANRHTTALLAINSIDCEGSVLWVVGDNPSPSRQYKRVTAVTLQAAREMMTLGLSVASIARKLGLTPNTVANWKTRGFPKRIG